MHNKLVMIILTLLSLAGCLSKPSLPGQHPGSISIRFTIKDEETGNQNVKARAENIKTIKAVLTIAEGDLRRETSVDFKGTETELTFSNIYPGDWILELSALDDVGDAIFQGTAEVNVNPGQHADATVVLLPAAASLDISFDASAIPGIGDTVKYGRLGIYLNPDPANNKATYYDLTLSGTFLTGVIRNLPEGSYSAKICVPNASSPIYVTPYFVVNLNAGKTARVRISPDGSVAVAGSIDSTPPTPQGLTATWNGNSVLLTWLPVNATDLAGYRIYRTDKNGRFCLLAVSAGTGTAFTDSNVNSSMAYHNRISYAVSSYDLAGNESLWSTSCSVTF